MCLAQGLATLHARIVDVLYIRCARPRVLCAPLFGYWGFTLLILAAGFVVFLLLSRLWFCLPLHSLDSGCGFCKVFTIARISLHCAAVSLLDFFLHIQVCTCMSRYCDPSVVQRKVFRFSCTASAWCRRFFFRVLNA